MVFPEVVEQGQQNRQPSDTRLDQHKARGYSCGTAEASIPVIARTSITTLPSTSSESGNMLW
jgi:hypothetical protein